MKREILLSDLIPMDIYASERLDRRKAISGLKRLRRVEVGPFVSFYFENFDTMFMQVHEMLFVEGGGEDQIPGELDAYNPLIPNGSELIATMMIEIGDATRRERELYKLSGIETNISIEFGDNGVIAEPVESEEVRTTSDGKTSAVHFIRFTLAEKQISAFTRPNNRLVLSIDHPNYSHMAVLSEQTREELSKDFSI